MQHSVQTSGELFSFLNITGVTAGDLEFGEKIQKVVVGVGPVGRACNILAGVWEDCPQFQFGAF